MTAVPVGDEVRDELGGGAMGEGQERGVDRRAARVPTVSPVVARCAWWPPIGSSSRSRPASPTICDVRVAASSRIELAADVAGRADDPDADPSRPAVAGTPRSERGRIPDDRSVAIAAGDPSPALTGARSLSREADSGGSPGSDGPSSWAHDYTAVAA